MTAILQKGEFINFLNKNKIEINTHTKARGHLGIFFKNRIDVAKNLDECQSVRVMAHEYAHYIHSKIESDMAKTHGNLEILFRSQAQDIEIIQKELYQLTLQVDKNASLKKFSDERLRLKSFIDVEEQLIKSYYPAFTRTGQFKEFEKYIKRSKARFFQKYDRIKLVSPFLRREEVYCIENIERDFPDIPEPFVAYLRLCSYKRRRAKLSRRINKYDKYYKQPSELFARFVESFFVDKRLATDYAPFATERFFNLLEMGYYFELKDLFIIANIYKLSR